MPHYLNIIIIMSSQKVEFPKTDSNIGTEGRVYYI